MGIDLGRFRSKKDDEWVDWLADDPVPASIRQKMRIKAVEEANQPVVRLPGRQQASSPAPPKTAETTAVSINIHLPSKDRLKQATKSLYDWLKVKLPGKRLPLAGAGLVGVIAIITVVTLVSDDRGTKAVLSDQDQQANFAYSLPGGKASNADSEVRFDETRKVVNFKDSIGGIEITISQQPLPADFKNDTEAKVKKLAEGFSANKSITTANPTAYLGTSVKGPQTVIFSKKDLLVFIQSVGEIDEHDWAEYVTNLK